MEEYLRNHPMVSWIAAILVFILFVILLLNMAKLLIELRRRLPRGARSRQLRLGFVETFDLDGERQLLLVRRDNVEHLLMIGGPNDVLVESGIVRVEPRETRAPRSHEQTPSAASILAPAPAAPILAPSPSSLPAEPVEEPSEALKDALAAALAQQAVESVKAQESVQDKQIVQDKAPDLAEDKAENRPFFADFAAPRRPEIPPRASEPALVVPPSAGRVLDPFAAPPEPESQPEPQPTPAIEPPQIAPPNPAPPASERPAPPRFTLPPRQNFRAPLPPSIRPVAPPTAGDQPRPRFVIPPLARRAAPPVAEPSASPGAEHPAPPAVEHMAPPVAEPVHPLLEPLAPPAESTPVEPEARPATEAPRVESLRELFGAPEEAPVATPAPQSTLDALDSLEEEMAKLLGRPSPNRPD